MVVLAVTGEGKVGVDIEEIRPVRLEDFSGFIPEVIELSRLFPGNPDYGRFFDCWTQREAVLKSHGSGLSAPAEQVILLERQGTALFSGAVWFLKKLTLRKGYSCHVATQEPVHQIMVESMNLMEGIPFP